MSSPLPGPPSTSPGVTKTPLNERGTPNDFVDQGGARIADLCGPPGGPTVPIQLAVCDVEGGTATIQLAAVDKDARFARIQANENIVEIASRRYKSSPMVLQGPGR